ncbi:hypothetical protein PUN28_002110 [Cardiocondyla obscurior]|uniref:Uncharacterized protein n=1 Tax=Cardiocondyla obscurior TaxID=286306 RepID=A0AAW2GSU3_9HYME
MVGMRNFADMVEFRKAPTPDFNKILGDYVTFHPDYEYQGQSWRKPHIIVLDAKPPTFKVTPWGYVTFYPDCEYQGQSWRKPHIMVLDAKNP